MNSAPEDIHISAIASTPGGITPGRKSVNPFLGFFAQDVNQYLYAVTDDELSDDSGADSDFELFSD